MTVPATHRIDGEPVPVLVVFLRALSEALAHEGGMDLRQGSPLDMAARSVGYLPKTVPVLAIDDPDGKSWFIQDTSSWRSPPSLQDVRIDALKREIESLREQLDRARSEKDTGDRPLRKYERRIPCLYSGQVAIVDVYRLSDVFELPAALSHALKKVLFAGQRGHKGEATDLLEAIESIERRRADLQEGGRWQHGTHVFSDVDQEGDEV